MAPGRAQLVQVVEQEDERLRSLAERRRQARRSPAERRDAQTTDRRGQARPARARPARTPTPAGRAGRSGRRRAGRVRSRRRAGAPGPPTRPTASTFRTRRARSRRRRPRCSVRTVSMSAARLTRPGRTRGTESLTSSRTSSSPASSRGDPARRVGHTLERRQRRPPRVLTLFRVVWSGPDSAAAASTAFCWQPTTGGRTRPRPGPRTPGTARSRCRRGTRRARRSRRSRRAPAPGTG